MNNIKILKIIIIIFSLISFSGLYTKSYSGEKKDPKSDSIIFNKLNTIEKEVKVLKSENDSMKIVFNEKLDLKNLYTWQLGFIGIIIAIVSIGLPIFLNWYNRKGLRKVKRQIKEKYNSLLLKINEYYQEQIAYIAFNDYLHYRNSLGKINTTIQTKKYINAYFEILKIIDNEKRNYLIVYLLEYLRDEANIILQFQQDFDKTTLVKFNNILKNEIKSKYYELHKEAIDYIIKILDDIIDK